MKVYIACFKEFWGDEDCEGTINWIVKDHANDTNCAGDFDGYKEAAKYAVSMGWEVVA